MILFLLIEDDDDNDDDDLTVTDGDGEYHDVCDINERPDDADDSQTAWRHDVNVDKSVFKIISEEWRHHVRHTLSHTE